MRGSRDGDGSHHDVLASVLATGLAGLLWATLASNHPTREFERLRQYRAPFRLWLPGWRLFAPDPGVHDLALVHRTRSTSGRVSAWSGVGGPTEREWWHMVVHPGKRGSASLRTAIQALLTESRRLPRSSIPGAASYELLEAHVRRHVRTRPAPPHVVDGFQFAILSHTGYDDTSDPAFLLVSAYTRLDAHRPGAGGAVAGARRQVEESVERRGRGTRNAAVTGQSEAVVRVVRRANELSAAWRLPVDAQVPDVARRASAPLAGTGVAQPDAPDQEDGVDRRSGTPDNSSVNRPVER